MSTRGDQYTARHASAKVVAFILSFLIASFSVVTCADAAAFAIEHDANGNVIQDKDRFYEYDAFNNLVKVRERNAQGRVLESYAYDDQGQRIKKVEFLAGGSNQTYYYLGDFVRKVNASGSYDSKYYYADTLVAENASGVMRYYHGDHLGSTSLITDASGNLLERSSYFPFGAELEGGGASRYGFTGQEQDSVGLSYYGSRYYDPFLGQFIQPDSILPNIYDPQQLNRYAYARNNPLKYTDPDGHSPTIITGLIGAAIGGAIGFFWNVGSQLWHGTRFKDISWGSAGTSAAIGAVAGFVAGLTLGIGNAIAGGAGISFGAELGIGSVSSVAGGRAGKATSNLFEGKEITDDLLNPYDIALDAVIGGATAGAGRGYRNNYIENSWSAGGKTSVQENLDYHLVTKNPQGYNAYRFTMEANAFKNNLGEQGLKSKYTTVGPYWDSPTGAFGSKVTGNGRMNPGFSVENPTTNELVIIDSYGKLQSYHSPSQT